MISFNDIGIFCQLLFPNCSLSEIVYMEDPYQKQDKQINHVCIHGMLKIPFSLLESKSWESPSTLSTKLYELCPLYASMQNPISIDFDNQHQINLQNNVIETRITINFDACNLSTLVRNLTSLVIDPVLVS